MKATFMTLKFINDRKYTQQSNNIQTCYKDQQGYLVKGKQTPKLSVEVANNCSFM